MDPREAYGTRDKEWQCSLHEALAIDELFRGAWPADAPPLVPGPVQVNRHVVVGQIQFSPDLTCLMDAVYGPRYRASMVYSLGWRLSTLALKHMGCTNDMLETADAALSVRIKTERIKMEYRAYVTLQSVPVEEAGVRYVVSLVLLNKDVP